MGLGADLAFPGSHAPKEDPSVTSSNWNQLPSRKEQNRRTELALEEFPSDLTSTQQNNTPLTFALTQSI
jgi:hypothetical protein